MNDAQERIGGDQVNDPEVEGHFCEWQHDVPRKAAVALPIKRKVRGGKAGAVIDTGQRLYTCHEHQKLAEEQNQVRPALRK